MRVFESFVNFIEHYDTKVKIPSKIAIKISGEVFYFDKKSTNNNDLIQKGQIDSYVFREESTKNTRIDFIVTYYRYYEGKVILEAYLLFFNDKEFLFLSPVYFFDNMFIHDKDFDHCKSSLHPDSIINRSGLKWVNTHFIPDAFMKCRNQAYVEAKKTLFYDLPGYLTYSDDEQPSIMKHIEERRRKKWHIDEHGKSPYFDKHLETPTDWEDFWVHYFRIR